MLNRFRIAAAVLLCGFAGPAVVGINHASEGSALAELFPFLNLVSPQGVHAVVAYRFVGCLIVGTVLNPLGADILMHAKQLLLLEVSVALYEGSVALGYVTEDINNLNTWRLLTPLHIINIAFGLYAMKVHNANPRAHSA